MEIIVPQKWTPADLRKADMARSEFRPSKATSAASNVLNQVDCQKAIVLCMDHSRMLKPSAPKYGYYRQREYPYVMGNCDHCNAFGKSDLYIHESVLSQVWTTRSRMRRVNENATLVNG